MATTVTLYDEIIGMEIRQLTNIKAILQKAQKWTADQGNSEDFLVSAKLAEDMKPLYFQVAAFCKMAFSSPIGPKWKYHLGDPNDKCGDNGFQGFYQRIDECLEFLKGFKEDDIQGDRPVDIWPRGEGTPPHFEWDSGAKFIRQMNTPQFYFHISITYAILRMKGVPIGKVDFLTAGVPFD